MPNTAGFYRPTWEARYPRRQEKQRELDEKMKAFPTKGGKVEKAKHTNPKEQLRSWKI